MRENRLIFFGESFGGEPDPAKRLREKQRELENGVQEGQNERPPGSAADEEYKAALEFMEEEKKGEKNTDIDPDEVDKKIADINESIDRLKLPTEDARDKLKGKFNELFFTLDGNIREVRVKEANDLNELFKRTMGELDGFLKGNPKLASIFKAISPFIKIEDDIVECEGDQKKITALFETHGIGKEQIKAYQGQIGVAQDGVWGPKTNTAFGKMKNGGDVEIESVSEKT